MSKIRAFTLIELLVVIAIIGLLSSITLAAVNTSRIKARDASRKVSLKEIQKALELYYAQYGVYPPPRMANTCGGARSDFATSLCTDQNWLSTDPAFLNYMPKIPRDPVNRMGANSASGPDDSPWWNALSYTYSTVAGGQDYDLLTNLESASDATRCELRLYKSLVFPGDTGCWSSATPGNVLDRAKQIWTFK